MTDTYDDYYLSGKAEAEWGEFIDAMFQYANETKENN